MNDGDLKNEKKNPDTCKTLEFRKEETVEELRHVMKRKKTETFPTSLER